MRYKYYTYETQNNSNRGRPIRPETWKSGPTPEQRDKYYAWLKHRAQARYRGEQYDLTWEQWDNLWTSDLFANRGKRADNWVIMRNKLSDSWNINNCEIVLRSDQLKRNGEYRQREK
jgi:hypothetical protein